MLKLLPIMMILSSCAFFSTPKERELPPSLMTGKNLDIKNPTALKQALLMKSSMAGGDFKMKVFPITAEYIQLNEQSWNQKKNWLSREELATTIAAQTKSYTRDRTCFSVELDVGRFDKMTDFKKWKGEVVDKEGNKYPVTWEHSSHDKPVKVVTIANFQGKKYNYIKKGKVCTSRKVATLTTKFTLNLEPTWIPFPFDDKFEITWEFDQYKKVNGEMVKVKKIKKKRHPWQ